MNTFGSTSRVYVPCLTGKGQPNDIRVSANDLWIEMLSPSPARLTPSNARQLATALSDAVRHVEFIMMRGPV